MRIPYDRLHRRNRLHIAIHVKRFSIIIQIARDLIQRYFDGQLIEILKFLRQRRIKFPNRVFHAVVARYGFFRARFDFDPIPRHGVNARMHRVGNYAHRGSFRSGPIQLCQQRRLRFIRRGP